MDKCPLCKRRGAPMEKHHLKTKRKDRNGIESICRECHKTIHSLYSNTEIRDPKRGLDSVEGLLLAEEFSKALRFIKKITPGAFMRSRSANSKGRRR